jgi:hypothetical protein
MLNTKELQELTEEYSAASDRIREHCMDVHLMVSETMSLLDFEQRKQLSIDLLRIISAGISEKTLKSFLEKQLQGNPPKPE